MQAIPRTFTAAKHLLLIVLALACAAPSAQTTAAQSLLARFAALQAQPGGNLFDKPVYLRSTEASERMQGDVYALVDHPYAALQQALKQAQTWCDIMILHLNVKYCQASAGAGKEGLAVGIGRKFDQPLADVYQVAFDFRVAALTDDRLNVLLQAPEGPLSTRDMRIEIEAVPFDAERSVLRMSYGYAYGTAARWAMQAYLATIGRDKRGFSVSGRGPDGTPELTGGVRGVLERNTVRYYLAIEAWLDARTLPAERQLQARLQGWFDATERYPQQLHELDRETYVAMKLREVERMHSQPLPARR